jgi:hypothetical protein
MNDKLEEVVNHPLFVPTVVGITTFISGFGAGFFFAKKRLETEITTKFEIHEVEVLDLDPEGTDMVVETTQAPIPVVIDEQVAKEKGIIKMDSLADLATSMVSDKPAQDEGPLLIPDPDEDNEVTITIKEATEESFVEDPSDDGIPWDWDEQLGKRLSTEPYILHLEEFTANELGFTQYALTFYALDEVLVDDNTVPVYNHSQTVGELKFGVGSGQEDVVYIRNHERKAEYEITRLDQSYAYEIHGLEIEQNEKIKDLRHGKLMKFRQD